MKVRVTIMTENDAHVDAPKEEIEKVATIGWKMMCNFMTANGDDGIATIENVEVVEM